MLYYVFFEWLNDKTSYSKTLETKMSLMLKANLELNTCKG